MSALSWANAGFAATMFRLIPPALLVAALHRDASRTACARQFCVCSWLAFAIGAVTVIKPQARMP